MSAKLNKNHKIKKKFKKYKKLKNVKHPNNTFSREKLCNIFHPDENM